MTSGFGPTPLMPQSSGQQLGGDWRQSLATLLCILLCFVVLLSICCTGIYLIKDKPVYEELVDYLDKSIAISKINYNQQLGFFELAENELQILEQHRMSFFALAILYCVTEAHVLAFMIFPYASLLPTVTENLLNHAIPYNPGGLVQMEQRLGCIFDLNLYAAQKRKQNPSNTCDPYISSAFIGKGTLWTFLALRLMPVVFFMVLISRKVALSEVLASVAQRFRAAIRSGNQRRKKASYFANSKRTIIGVPSTAPTTRYNNAAYFATSTAPGPNGLNSSSSEISRSDAIDLYRPPVQTSSSIMSEV
ncbi:unnamed protein product [Litomosoides sigmodontis]|uniref:Uncharacterized protein n=1 Tax=Litomosoides sigmodontis TaxID=42156 RepID=A0A3P6S8F5_LITSI|nr:unnamed protein product [Litomosoides sigmodontis]